MLRSASFFPLAVLLLGVTACDSPSAPPRPRAREAPFGVQGAPALTGTIYVTDRAANRVWAIDAATGQILDSARTQTRPIGVERAAGKLYTANESSNSVSVFDAATLDSLKVIALPGCPMPHHTHTSTDEARVYVACFRTNKVAVIDTRTDEVEAVWTSGGDSAVTHQPWATTNGQSVWVANTRSRDVTELDGRTGAILRRIPTLDNPVEIVIHPSNRLGYVSIVGQNTVQIFDLGSGALVKNLAVPAPENLMISRDGQRVLASTGGRRSPSTSASIIDTRTLAVTTIALPGTLATHNDLTENGKYAFVSLEGFGTGAHGVAVIDMEAAAVQAFYAIPGAQSPHGVRWAPNLKGR